MLSDEHIANRITRWWAKRYKGTPPHKVEEMVRKWIVETTSWGPRMPLEERVKLQNRVSHLIRSRNAVSAAKTRKKNRREALRPKQEEFQF